MIESRKEKTNWAKPGDKNEGKNTNWAKPGDRSEGKESGLNLVTKVRVKTQTGLKLVTRMKRKSTNWAKPDYKSEVNIKQPRNHNLTVTLQGNIKKSSQQRCPRAKIEEFMNGATGWKLCLQQGAAPEFEGR